MSDEAAGEHDYTVPDFKADERVLLSWDREAKEYIEAAIRNEIADLRVQTESRRETAQKGVEKAWATHQQAKDSAQKKVAAYRKAAPKRVKPPFGVVSPGIGDILKTGGGAFLLYGAARKAIKAEHAAADQLRAAEQQLDRLKNQITGLATDVEAKARARFAGPEGEKELAMVATLSAIVARHKAIRSERDDFSTRLQSGKVSPFEYRDRAFSQTGRRLMAGELEGLILAEQWTIGGEGAPETSSWWVAVDRRSMQYVIPYDPQLKALTNLRFDLHEGAGGDYVAVPSARQDVVPREPKEHEGAFPTGRRPNPEVIKALRKLAEQQLAGGGE